MSASKPLLSAIDAAVQQGAWEDLRSHWPSRPASISNNNPWLLLLSAISAASRGRRAREQRLPLLDAALAKAMPWLMAPYFGWLTTWNAPEMGYRYRNLHKSPLQVGTRTGRLDDASHYPLLSRLFNLNLTQSASALMSLGATGWAGRPVSTPWVNWLREMEPTHLDILLSNPQSGQTPELAQEFWEQFLYRLSVLPEKLAPIVRESTPRLLAAIPLEPKQWEAVWASFLTGWEGKDRTGQLSWFMSQAPQPPPSCPAQSCLASSQWKNLPVSEIPAFWATLSPLDKAHQVRQLKDVLNDWEEKEEERISPEASALWNCALAESPSFWHEHLLQDVGPLLLHHPRPHPSWMLAAPEWLKGHLSSETQAWAQVRHVADANWLRSAGIPWESPSSGGYGWVNLLTDAVSRRDEALATWLLDHRSDIPPSEQRLGAVSWLALARNLPALRPRLATEPASSELETSLVAGLVGVHAQQSGLRTAAWTAQEKDTIATEVVRNWLGVTIQSGNHLSNDVVFRKVLGDHAWSPTSSQLEELLAPACLAHHRHTQDARVITISTASHKGLDLLGQALAAQSPSAWSSTWVPLLAELVCRVGSRDPDSLAKFQIMSWPQPVVLAVIEEILVSWEKKSTNATIAASPPGAVMAKMLENHSDLTPFLGFQDRIQASWSSHEQEYSEEGEPVRIPPVCITMSARWQSQCIAQALRGVIQEPTARASRPRI
jgi:hypothetical protein